MIYVRDLGDFANRPENPVSTLMLRVGRSVLHVVRERQESFACEVNDFYIDLVESSRLFCRVDLEGRRIEISSRLVETLWAVAYAYFHVHERLLASDTGEVIELQQEAELRQATNLLAWALERWFNSDDSAWPADLPRPTANAEDRSNGQMADTIALHAVGAILHHEISHLELGHHGPDLDAERDADRRASAEVFGGLAIDDDRFIVRGFGIATAVLMQIAAGIHCGSYMGTTHPRSFDRLLISLEPFVDDPRHPIWLYVMSALHLHLENCDLPYQLPDDSQATPRAHVDALLDVLARHERDIRLQAEAAANEG